MIKPIHGIEYNDVTSYIKTINQYSVWEYLLGYNIHRRFTNPFRVDNNPSCYLYTDKQGIVRLSDMADRQYHTMNVLDAVKYKYNLKFFEALFKLYEITRLCDKNNELIINKIKNTKSKVKNGKSRIMGIRRKWSECDRDFWSLREISKNQLEEDFVYPLSSFYINSMNIIASNKAYCFNFESGNIKIYQPDEHEYKWYSNVDNNDVWFWNNHSNVLIITKGYKEGRICFNNTEYDVVAIQNEAIKKIPDKYLNYDFVYVLFDNDKTGIELAEYYQTNYGYEPVYIHNYNDLDEFFINQPEECKKLLKSL